MTSTVAPTSSSFFFMSAASALAIFSFTGLGRPVDEILGLLEAETRQLAHDLDHLDLLVARRVEDRRRTPSSPPAAAPPPPPPAAGGRDRHRRRRRHAPLLLQELRELGRLQQRQRVQLLRDLFDIRRHVSLPPVGAPSWLTRLLARPTRRRSCSAPPAPRTSSRCGAVSSDTSCAIGPCRAPTSWLRSASFEGRSASARSSAGSSDLALDESHLDGERRVRPAEGLQRLGHRSPGPAARSRGRSAP